jgi:hypothetical protein
MRVVGTVTTVKTYGYVCRFEDTFWGHGSIVDDVFTGITERRQPYHARKRQFKNSEWWAS